MREKIECPQSAFYVNLYRAVIGPSDVDLRRMLAGSSAIIIYVSI